jgi:hypothetical protein
MGGLMFILTIASFLEKGSSGTGGPLLDKGKLTLVGMTVAALWLYAFLLSIIGFVVDTLLLMLFLFAAVQKVRWTAAIFVSIASVAICYFLFSSLGAEFPRGIFP